MKKQILSLAAGAALLVAAQNSFAEPPTAAGSLNYEVILNGSCSVTTPIGAGGIKNLDTQSGVTYVDATDKDAGTVVVKCSNMAYAICVNKGENYSASNKRQLKHIVTGVDYLTYDLKNSVGGLLVGDKGCSALDSGYTDTTDITQPAINATGTGADQSYSLLADVIIPPASKAGTYRDLVGLTVVW